MKNIRENYNKEEKQEEDNLSYHKYFFYYLKVGNFTIEKYLNWWNTLLNIKNSIVNLYKTELLMFFIYSLVS